MDATGSKENRGDSMEKENRKDKRLCIDSPSTLLSPASRLPVKKIIRAPDPLASRFSNMVNIGDPNLETTALDETLNLGKMGVVGAIGDVNLEQTALEESTMAAIGSDANLEETALEESSATLVVDDTNSDHAVLEVHGAELVSRAFDSMASSFSNVADIGDHNLETTALDETVSCDKTGVVGAIGDANLEQTALEESTMAVIGSDANLEETALEESSATLVVDDTNSDHAVLEGHAAELVSRAPDSMVPSFSNMADIGSRNLETTAFSETVSCDRTGVVGAIGDTNLEQTALEESTIAMADSDTNLVESALEESSATLAADDTNLDRTVHEDSSAELINRGTDPLVSRFSTSVTIGDPNLETAALDQTLNPGKMSVVGEVGDANLEQTALEESTVGAIGSETILEEAALVEASATLIVDDTSANQSVLEDNSAERGKQFCVDSPSTSTLLSPACGLPVEKINTARIPLASSFSNVADIDDPNLETTALDETGSCIRTGVVGTIGDANLEQTALEESTMAVIDSDINLEESAFERSSATLVVDDTSSDQAVLEDSTMTMVADDIVAEASGSIAPGTSLFDELANADMDSSVANESLPAVGINDLTQKAATPLSPEVDIPSQLEAKKKGVKLDSIDPPSTPRRLEEYARERVSDYSFLISEAYCEKEVFCDNCYKMRVELEKLAEKFHIALSSETETAARPVIDQSSLRRLEEALAASKSQLDTVISEKNKLQQDLVGAERERDLARKDFEDFKFFIDRDLKKSKDEKRQLYVEISELGSKLEKSVEDARVLKEKADLATDLERRLAETLTEKQDLQAEVDRFGKEMAPKEELEELQRRLLGFQKERDELQQQVAALEESQSTLSRELSESKILFMQQKEELESAEKEKTNATAKLAEVEESEAAKRRSLSERIEEMESNIAYLEKKIEIGTLKLQKSIEDVCVLKEKADLASDLEKKLAEALIDKQNLQAEVDRLGKEMAPRRELEELQNSLLELQKERDELQQQVATLEESQSTLSRELSEGKLLFMRQKEALESAEKEKNSAIAKLAEVEESEAEKTKSSSERIVELMSDMAYMEKELEIGKLQLKESVEYACVLEEKANLAADLEKRLAEALVDKQLLEAEVYRFGREMTLNEGLKEELQELERRLLGFQKERDELQQQIAALEESQSTLNRELSEGKLVFMRQKEALEHAEKEKSDAVTKLAELEKAEAVKMKSSSERIEEMKSSIACLEKQIEDGKLKLEKSIEDARGLKEKAELASDLEKRLAEALIDKQNLQAEVDRLGKEMAPREELVELERRLLGFQEERDELQQQIGTLVESQSTLSRELSEGKILFMRQKEALERTEKEKGDAVAKLAEVEESEAAKRKSSLERIEEMESNIARLEKQIEAGKLELEKSIENACVLKEKADLAAGLEKRLAEELVDKQNLQAEIDRLGKEMAPREELRKLEVRLLGFQEEKDELQRQIRTLEESQSTLSRELSEGKRGFMRQKEALERAEKERNDAVAKLAEVKESEAEKTKSSSERIEEMEKKIAYLEKQNDRLGNACDDADEEVAQLRVDLFETRKKLVRLEGTQQGWSEEEMACRVGDINFAAQPKQAEQPPQMSAPKHVESNTVVNVKTPVPKKDTAKADGKGTPKTPTGKPVSTPEAERTSSARKWGGDQCRQQ